MKDFWSRLCQVRFLGFAAILLLWQAAPSLAQVNDEPTETDIAEAEAIAADIDGSLDDANSSIEINGKQRGFSLSADIRTLYTPSER